jgi:hypothetical protein
MRLTEFDTVAACNRGADMAVNDPRTGAPARDEKGNPAVVITVAGVDSDRYANWVRARIDASMAETAPMRRSAHDLEQDEIDLLTACTIGWRGFEGDDGAPHPFTNDNARELYRQFPLIRAQAKAFVEQRRNFTRG